MYLLRTNEVNLLTDFEVRRRCRTDLDKNCSWRRRHGGAWRREAPSLAAGLRRGVCRCSAVRRDGGGVGGDGENLVQEGLIQGNFSFKHTTTAGLLSRVLANSYGGVTPKPNLRQRRRGIVHVCEGGLPALDSRQY